MAEVSNHVNIVNMLGACSKGGTMSMDKLKLLFR